jgi:hypothetical protein
MAERDTRRPGRPPLARDDQSVAVSIKMPSRQYDSLFERAQRERVSVPELIRRQLSATDDDE